MCCRCDKDVYDLEKKVDNLEEKMHCLKHDIKAVSLHADRLEQGILKTGEIVTDPATDAAIIRSMQKEIERLSGLLKFCVQEADKIEKMKQKVESLWSQANAPQS